MASRQIDKMSFRGCYCSVFDECWISDLNSLATQHLKSCPANADSFVVSVP